MRAISTVSMPQRPAGAGTSANRIRQRPAALMRANDECGVGSREAAAEDERNVARRLLRRRRHRQCPRTPDRRARGWRCRERRSSRERASASTASMMPAAAIRCPIAHLKPVTGGIAAPNTLRIAAASERSDCGVPLPCATIMPTSAARVRASSSACANRSREARRRRRGSRAGPAPRTRSRRRGSRRAPSRCARSQRLRSRGTARRRLRRRGCRRAARRTGRSVPDASNPMR